MFCCFTKLPIILKISRSPWSAHNYWCSTIFLIILPSRRTMIRKEQVHCERLAPWVRKQPRRLLVEVEPDLVRARDLVCFGRRSWEMICACGRWVCAYSGDGQHSGMHPTSPPRCCTTPKFCPFHRRFLTVNLREELVPHGSSASASAYSHEPVHILALALADLFSLPHYLRRLSLLTAWTVPWHP